MIKGPVPERENKAWYEESGKKAKLFRVKT